MNPTADGREAFLKKAAEVYDRIVGRAGFGRVVRPDRGAGGGRGAGSAADAPRAASGRRSAGRVLDRAVPPVRSAHASAGGVGPEASGHLLRPGFLCPPTRDLRPVRPLFFPRWTAVWASRPGAAPVA